MLAPSWKNNMETDFYSLPSAVNRGNFFPLSEELNYYNITCVVCSCVKEEENCSQHMS